MGNLQYGISVLLAGALLLTGCFESEGESKKVDLVDKRSTDDPTADKQAVSDEDFAALQAKIKSLESKLAALESGKADSTKVTSLESDVAAHGETITSHVAELAALGSSLNGIEQSAQKQLWMYDGNKVKRHKVVSIQEAYPGTSANQQHQAIVELATGVRARYQIGVVPQNRPNESPSPLERGGIAFSGLNCSGEPTISDGSVRTDLALAGTMFDYVAWVSAEAKAYVGGGNLIQSGYSAADGSCTNSSGTATSTNRVAELRPLNDFKYPNPLTVGP